MNTLTKHCFLLISIMGLSFCNSIKAQLKPTLVNFPNPNAASLGMYGQILVNHFTGVPNIEIPVYTLADRDIQIPLTLNYRVAPVKLNAHPGWTGLGWEVRSQGLSMEGPTRSIREPGRDLVIKDWRTSRMALFISW